MDEGLRTAGEFAVSATAVWFAVYAVRAWLPGAAREWLDGPMRVLPLVYAAAFGLTVLADGDLSRATALDALNVAVGAVGVDRLRRLPERTEPPQLRTVEHEAQ